MVDVECKICHSNSSISTRNVYDYEYRTAGVWDYYKCSRCGVVQINPFPKNIDEIKSFYPKNYHNFKKSYLFHMLNNIVLRLRVASLRLDKDRPLSIIDVGAGDCAMLDFIRKSYQTKELIAFDFYFHQKFRHIKQIEQQFCYSTLNENFYDLITMNNYLEHVQNPALELKLALKYLNNKGFISGIVPNYNSLDRMIFRRYWGGMHTPRHLYHFDKKSLTKLLVKAGFKNILIKNELHSGHLSISINNLVIRLLGIKKSRIPLFSILTLCLLPISLLLSIFGLNGSMTFNARKY